MRREVVLFDNTDIDPEKKKDFMEEVAKIFSLEILFYKDEYFLLEKKYYKKALESKMKGERVFGRVRLTNYAIIDRFNPDFVNVVKKYYPLFVSTISISYGDKYRITNFGSGDGIEIFDNDEWVEY